MKYNLLICTMLLLSSCFKEKSSVETPVTAGDGLTLDILEPPRYHYQLFYDESLKVQIPRADGTILQPMQTVVFNEWTNPFTWGNHSKRRISPNKDLESLPKCMLTMKIRVSIECRLT